jgi:3-hydroxyanthranilate 3,4-dioxygenase
MVVAGPNARKDFHYNETEELFYQLEGSITIITQGWRTQCLELHAGDMYLHPAKVPILSAEGSIGLVIERKGQDKAILTVYCGFVRAAIINYMRYTLS